MKKWLGINAVSLIAVLLLGVVIIFLFINPLGTALNNLGLYSNAQIDSLKKENASLRSSLKVTNNNVMTLAGSIDERPTFEQLYGKPYDSIPQFVSEITVELDSGGVVSDTISTSSQLVPNILNWRDWKGMKQIPTKVINSLKFEADGDNYVTFTYEPVFTQAISNVTKVETKTKKVAGEKKKTEPVKPKTNNDWF